MPRGLFIDKPKHASMKPYRDPPLEPHQVRMHTEFASIKHGTLFHMFSGESPFQNRRFDRDLRLFVKKEKPDASGGLVGQFIGNMAVGTVSETGEAVTRFKPGDRVYCYGPACQTLTKPENDVHPLVAPMDDLDAVCLDPAHFALGVIRDAGICVGDNVVSFGLGAIGLFVVQLLKMAGCANIISVDPIAERRQLAESLGADLVLDPTELDVAVETRRYLGQGADIAIEASGQYKALHEAMRSVGQCGRIATLGYYKGVDTELELGAEWLHNRLELICSLPDWENPLREYPLWDRQRLYDTLITWFQREALTSEGIVTPIVDFVDSAQAFMDIYSNPSTAIKLGIEFPR